jgi:type IV pilus assembly protein PilB
LFSTLEGDKPASRSHRNRGGDSETLVYVSKDILSNPRGGQSGGDAGGNGSEALPEESEGPESDARQALLDQVQPEAVKTIAWEMARYYRLIPVRIAGNLLTVAMADPRDVVAIDNIKMASGLEVKPIAWDVDVILEAIELFYAKRRKRVRIRVQGQDANVQYLDREDEDQDLDFDEVDDAPTIRLLNSLLSTAVEDGASDIHIEPAEDMGRVRFRLDGVLHEVDVLPRQMMTRLTSRIKILSSLDIAERRVPQDGRFSIQYKEKDVDLRVATLPTIYGESCIIRLLDQSKSDISMDSMGFLTDQRDLIVRALAKPSGMVLVTGPTGSGKTTTLCAMLNYVNSLEKKIITLEDPVEYRLDIINQMNRNPAAGVTFSNGLRAILRSDPDIVLVGEIRDRESARIAVQAALTGHLLLSTLHTTGTAETLTRLLDLGVEPFYAREVVELIVAQRLVRVLCPNCKKSYHPSPDLAIALGKVAGNTTLFRPVGCNRCRNTGYRGRTAVFEVLPITEGIRRALKPETTAAEIKDLAKKEGLTTFWECAVEKVADGCTSLEEVLCYAPDQVRPKLGVETAPAEPAVDFTGGDTGAPVETGEPAQCSIHPGQEIIARCTECRQPVCQYCIGGSKGNALLCQKCAAGIKMLYEALAEEGMVGGT